MLILKTTKSILTYLSDLRSKGKRIGFAPTMGALHNGHLALLERTLAENDICVASIFVNPTQFNDKKDLDRYPRTFESDLEKLIACGCHVLFYPNVEEIYPSEGIEPVSVDFGHLLKTMEAVFRKGHFEGVAQVVKRLLDIVQPHSLYMGQKDYQQFLVVKKMIESLGLNIKLVMCPTVREDDGLAMSSRNVLMTREEREAASEIPKVLFEAKEKIRSGISFSKLKLQGIERLNNFPLLKVEYFDIVNSETLMPAKDDNSSSDVAICAAVKAGDVRLIDNILIA